VVGELAAQEFAVLDIEYNSSYFTLPQSQWGDFILQFCERVEERIGGPVAVYISESPAKSMPDDCALYPLWVAGYVSNPPSDWEDWPVGPWPAPAIWQYSSDGVIDGIDGRCDVNIAPDDLAARLGLQTEDDDVALTLEEHNALIFLGQMLNDVKKGIEDGSGKPLDQAIAEMLKKKG
jgi:GH25 family lysozyme M1 (1,4-beta-N-acetylmuramidase)